MKKNLLRFLIYFIAFILPILGMINCSGWSEGTMEVSYCVKGGMFSKIYANFYYSLIFYSAFMLLIPLVIYIGGIIFFIEKIFLKFFSFILEKENQNITITKEVKYMLIFGIIFTLSPYVIDWVIELEFMSGISNSTDGYIKDYTNMIFNPYFLILKTVFLIIGLLLVFIGCLKNSGKKITKISKYMLYFGGGLLVMISVFTSLVMVQALKLPNIFQESNLFLIFINFLYLFGLIVLLIGCIRHKKEIKVKSNLLLIMGVFLYVISTLILFF